MEDKYLSLASVKKKRQHEYISFRRYDHKALSGRQLNFPIGVKLRDYNGLLLLDTEPVCTTHSQNGRQHFAPNYDDEGIERGRLTYAISESARPHRHGFRFLDSEWEWMQKNWSQYLQEGSHWLFNDAFFKAPLIHLRAIADRLLIRFSDDVITL